MIKNNIKIGILLAATLFTSCSALDEMPDNRAEVTSKTDIQKMLVSAYSENSSIYVTELYSDNTDDIGGENNPNSDKFDDEVYNWIDTQQQSSTNESTLNIWEGYYKAIAAANLALKTIDELGDTADLEPEKAEALIARAYAHFVLVNVFCQHYTKEFSKTDLGIPFAEELETTLEPKYERGTVADVYDKIDKDLQIALPLVSDEYYNVPKYHFNVDAANAFAARFYLYYQDFDKAIAYASKVLGSDPTRVTRDNATLSLIPRDPLTTVSIQFIAESDKSNLLLQTQYSNLGIVYGAYYSGSRHNHATYTATTESIAYPGPWGTSNNYYLRPWLYSGTNLDKALLPHLPYIFQYTDPVAGIGYRRTVNSAFNTNETLLVRAEAYILKKDYTNALIDMNAWIKSSYKDSYTLTETDVNNWIGNVKYYEPLAPTPKKKLNPEFSIEQGGLQENMLHLVLFMRRYETLHTGLRWFDQKRYNITGYRRLILSSVVNSVTDSMNERDPRRAIQIPKEVINAGMQPNPR